MEKPHHGHVTSYAHVLTGSLFLPGEKAKPRMLAVQDWIVESKVCVFRECVRQRPQPSLALGRLLPSSQDHSQATIANSQG
jgi:hypothetical protein